jgi:hypothetical protein
MTNISSFQDTHTAVITPRHSTDITESNASPGTRSHDEQIDIPAAAQQYVNDSNPQFGDDRTPTTSSDNSAHLGEYSGSVHDSDDGFTAEVRHRTTWPRNNRGTYLPFVESSSQ